MRLSELEYFWCCQTWCCHARTFWDISGEVLDCIQGGFGSVAGECNFPSSGFLFAECCHAQGGLLDPSNVCIYLGFAISANRTTIFSISFLCVLVGGCEILRFWYQSKVGGLGNGKKEG